MTVTVVAAPMHLAEIVEHRTQAGQLVLGKTAG
jgi:hypothetical protein